MPRLAQDIDRPETSEEFWVLTEASKDDLSALVAKYHPSYKRHFHKGKITAQMAEKVCGAVRNQIQQEERETDPQQEFRALLNRKDPDIVKIFNEVWWGMPESMESYNAKGFAILCLLCEGIPREGGF